MASPRYAIRLKTLNRYNYRGVLYKWKDETSRKRNSYAVSRVLRDHLVSTGFFEDVRSVEPTPVAPEPVAEPEAIVEVDPATEASVMVEQIDPTPPEPESPPIVVNESPKGDTAAAEPAGGDMSRESVTGYGKPKSTKGEGIEV